VENNICLYGEMMSGKNREDDWRMGDNGKLKSF
jgi:hypothetical protein